MKTNWVATLDASKFKKVLPYYMNLYSVIIIILITILSSCSKNDELETLVYNEISFENTYETINEGEDGLHVIINVNKPFKKDALILIRNNGLFDLKIEGAYVDSYGNIAINFLKGTEQVDFVIKKPNDNVISRHSPLMLELTDIEHTNIKTGQNRLQIIEIMDDELSGYPKSISNQTGSYISTYFYRIDGLIQKIETKSIFGGESYVSIKNYEYNENSKIIKITESFNTQQQSWVESYIYENERIVKSTYNDKQTRYYYNLNNQIISKIDTYYSYGVEWLEINYNYTYHNNGNISKIEEITPSYYWENLLIPSTRKITNFLEYNENINFFQELQIIPDNAIQYNLPSLIEEIIEDVDNNKILYRSEFQYLYEFDSSNRVISKTTGTEKYEYKYY